MNKTTISIILSILLLPTFAAAHPGPLNKDGGHYDLVTQQYHYHNRNTPDKPLYSPNIHEEPPFQKTFRATKTTTSHNSVLVTQIIELDVVEVELHHKKERIRLSKTDIPQTSVATEATCKNYLKELMENQIVVLRHENIRDKEGCLLGEILWNGMNIKDAIVNCMSNTEGKKDN